MSKFRGYTFQVVPKSGKQFPIISRESDNFYWWKGTIYFTTLTQLNSFRELLTIGTPKRPIGTTGVVLHIEAGRTLTSSLQVPNQAGQTQDVQAVMLTCNNIQVYGGHANSNAMNKQYQCDVEFLIMEDPAT